MLLKLQKEGRSVREVQALSGLRNRGGIDG